MASVSYRHAASRAILTTDTRPKVVAREIELTEGGPAPMLGLAKGSGMIHPDIWRRCSRSY